MAGHPDHVIELVGGIEMDGDAGLDGHPDLLIPLVESVENDQIGIGAGEQRQVQLTRTERVSSGAGQGEDPPHG